MQEVPLDYAPPRRRPGRLTWRTACVALALLLAGIAALTIVPHVMGRSYLLKCQRALLDGEHGGTPWRDGNATRVMPPELMSIDRWAGGLATSLAPAHVGGHARPGGEGRLVVVTPAPLPEAGGPATEVALLTQVVEPGGWLSPPRLLFIDDHDVCIPPSRLGPGRPVPGDSAAWELPLLSDGDPPRELGVLRGRLMGGERVAWELIPTVGTPDAPPRSSGPEAAG